MTALRLCTKFDSEAQKNKNQQALCVKNDVQLFQKSDIASHLFTLSPIVPVNKNI